MTQKKGILFDLDQTLVDTSSLYGLRKQRNWRVVFERIHLTKLYPGIKELLNELKEHYKIGIVTSSISKYAEKVIRHHQIPIPLFAAYHDTAEHKPHPAPILLGIKKLGCLANDTISIGDETRDVIAAQRAGAVAIAVTWGLDSQDDLKNTEPFAIANNIPQLRQILLSEKEV